MTEVTTQRVGEVLSETADFIADHSYAKTMVVTDPKTGEEVAAYLTPSGHLNFIDRDTFDRHHGKPSVRKGMARMTSLDSFIAHVNRFGDADSAIFANEDRSSPSVLAVLDYHRADTLPTEDGGDNVHGEYRFGEHRTNFAFPVSEEWKAWHAQNDVKMDMPEFAAFLEDNVLDVAEVEAVPESAERFVKMGGGEKNIADWSKLTALAKSLTVFENAVVGEAVNLASGEGQLVINNSHDTEVAGIKATVPTMFFIAIPIFREGPVYRLPVRLRYRKAGSRISFWYEIWRSDRAFKDAFNEAVERIGKETSAQVFYGQPEA